MNRWNPRQFAKAAAALPLQDKREPRLVWVTTAALQRAVDAWKMGVLETMKHPLPTEPIIFGFENRIGCGVEDIHLSTQVVSVEYCGDMPSFARRNNDPHASDVMMVGRILQGWAGRSFLSAAILSEFGGAPEEPLQRCFPGSIGIAPPALGGDPERYAYGWLTASMNVAVVGVWALMNEPAAQDDAAITIGASPLSIGKKRTRRDVDVSVVDIRRPTNVRYLPSAHRIEHDHRWTVTGHWRNQACGPEHSLRKRIWVDDYVAGPEDKPLIRRPRVQRVS